MSPRARLAVLGLAAALAFGALALHFWGSAKSEPVAYMLGLQAALIVIGTVFDARYRGRNSSSAARGQWQDTGERELDYTSGTAIEVWFDPVSGERRYVPAGHAPD